MLAGIGLMYAIAHACYILFLGSKRQHRQHQIMIEQQRMKAANDLYDMIISSPDEVLINCLHRPDANAMLISEVKKELSRRGVEWE